jgi:hypothetical protein
MIFRNLTRRYIPEDSILHSHRYENFKIHCAKSRLFAAKNPNCNWFCSGRLFKRLRPRLYSSSTAPSDQESGLQRLHHQSISLSTVNSEAAGFSDNGNILAYAWESGCIDPRIVDLGISWMRVVSLTLRPLYRQGNSPQVPIGQEAGWAPEPVWMTRRKNSCTIGTRTLSSLPSSP